MVKQLYVLFDLVAQEAGPIFEAKNLGVAKRSVVDMVLNKNLPADQYNLILVGSINTEKVEVEVLYNTYSIVEIMDEYYDSINILEVKR